MKKSLFAIAAIACLGMFSAACDEDSVNDFFNGLTDGALICTDIDGEDEDNDCNKYCEEAGLNCGEAGACQVNLISGNPVAKCVVSKEVCDAQGLEVTHVTLHTSNGTAYESYSCASAAQDVTCNKDADCDVENGYKCDIDGDYVQMNHCYNPAEYGVTGDEYKYVKIQDESPVSNKGEDPGADIDAVVLMKADNSQYYASDVKAYFRGDGTSSVEKNKAFVPDAILGAPDSVIDVTNPDGKCKYLDMEKTVDKANDAFFTFVSLGGKTEGKDGGYIIVEMQKGMENGDKLFVVELGDCALVAETTQSGNSSNAITEAISVSVAVSDDYSNNSWVPVINSSKAVKGVVTGTIANL